MTTAPITITTTARQTTSIPVSPLTVLMLIAREAGVTPAVNTIALVDDANPAAVLGAATNEGRRWYELVEGQSNVNLFVIPFDSADPATNGPAALNALLNPVQRAKLYAVSPYGVDVVHAGKYTGAALTANAIVAALETVCVDPRVKAAWIGDGYAGPAYNHSQTLANVQAWVGTNGTRRSGIALANGAPVANSQEFGSAIALATIARHAGLVGIGAHPFNLSDVILGIGSPLSGVRVRLGRRVLRGGGAGQHQQDERHYHQRRFPLPVGRQYHLAGRRPAQLVGKPGGPEPDRQAAAPDHGAVCRAAFVGGHARRHARRA